MLTSLGWNTILPGCWDYYICAVNTKTIGAFTVAANAASAAAADAD
jgi:hypothetical protein